MNVTSTADTLDCVGAKNVTKIPCRFERKVVCYTVKERKKAISCVS
jgi:hypothetical protein